jgi:ParB/RepB/Spo0J family partition protein
MIKGLDIAIDKIEPSPYQPRLTFDLEDIKGSIQRDGILVALTVRKKNGYYELIDGERRLRLAKELGYKTLPCDVIDIDDDTARRMVWKVNTLRKDYEPKEKAIFFKTMQEKYGMSLTGIAGEYDSDRHTVKAYLNVFKLPDEYQQMAWDRVIPIGVVKELEVLFNSGRYLPLDRLTPEKAPEIFEILDRAVKEKYFGQKEVQEAIRPYLTKFREERVEKAKEALAEVKPEVVVPKTPEEFEEAAKALRKRAKELKTPEQILEEKREKARKVLLSGKGNALSKIEKAKELGVDATEFEERLDQLKERITSDPEATLKEAKELKADVDKVVKAFKEEESKRRLEEELRGKIEKEVEERTVQKMLSTPEYLEAAKSIPTPVFESEEVTIPPEEVEAIKKRYDEVKQKLDEIIQLPEVRKRGMLFKNWHSHYILAQGLPNAFCPVDGKEKSGELVWSCCGLSAKEALKIAGDRFEESQKKK